MDLVFKLATTIMIFTSFLCLYRGIIGPSVADRMIVVNTIGTKVIVILSLFSFVFKSNSYLDVAIVYAMASFMVTISVAKYKREGKLF